MADLATLRSRLVDLGFNLSRRLNHPLVRPDWVSVNVTLKCNLKCVMCRTCYDAPYELDTGELKSIARQTAEWGVPIFNPLGGEPFLRRDLIEILEFAHGLGLVSTVTTNGTLIGENAARQLARLPRVHLNVSIDGPEPANDRVRAPGAYKKAVAAIRRVREAETAAAGEFAARGEPFWPKQINVNCIINRANADDLVPFAEEMRRAGASKIQWLNLFDFAAPKDAGTERWREDLWFRPADLPALDRAIDALIAYSRTDGAIPFVAGEADLRLVKRYYRGDLRPRHAPCYNGFKELYINVDGEGLMCDGKLDFLASSFGNARREPIRKMWRSRRARGMRKKVLRCRHACVQDCYLRRQSDDVAAILRDIAGALKG
ncbi:MAG: radical SAM protein [Deltaproteobacteria bacterium]|nr:radical SAM protein [Deltaproteobacteria bacterium]